MDQNRGPAGRARRPAGDVAAWISILPHPAQHSGRIAAPLLVTNLCVLPRSSGTDYTAPGSRGLTVRITVTGSGMATSADKRNPGGSESTLLSHLESLPENRAKVMETGASSARHLSTWTQFVETESSSKEATDPPSPSVFMPVWTLPILHQALGQFLHLPSGLIWLKRKRQKWAWPGSSETAINCLETSASASWGTEQVQALLVDKETT